MTAVAMLFSPCTSDLFNHFCLRHSYCYSSTIHTPITIFKPGLMCLEAAMREMKRCQGQARGMYTLCPLSINLLANVHSLENKRDDE